MTNLQEIAKRKAELREKIEDKFYIPIHIINLINNKVEETAKLNGEDFNKRTFKLGLTTMYYMLKHSNKLKHDQD